MQLETYYASDRRVYDGAICSDMRGESEHTAMLEKRLKKADPTAHCTYFPMGGKYLVFVGYKQLSKQFHGDRQTALIDAIQTLEKPV